MSDGMGFGYYTGDNDGQDDLALQQQQAAQQQGQAPAGRNPLRDHLKSLEEKAKAQDALIQQLLAESHRAKVADALEAKGYDRGAAALYQGAPDKVDDWLNTAGTFLAKKPETQQGTGAGQQGTPASTVDAAGQAQLQTMQQAGQNAAGPQGSDAEQAAAIAALGDGAALTAYLAANGNQYAQYYNG